MFSIESKLLTRWDRLFTETRDDYLIRGKTVTISSEMNYPRKV